MTRSNSSAAVSTTTNSTFVDVLSVFTQRKHEISLAFFYQHFPELSDYLDTIPRTLEARTIWTSEVRHAIIHVADSLGIDLSQYAPFDLRQPFNAQGVRRMLARLALVVAGRMTKEDAPDVHKWLKVQRQHRDTVAHAWTVLVCYDGDAVPPLYPSTRR